MRLEVLLPLAVLFIAQGVPSYAQSSEGAVAASTAAPAAVTTVPQPPLEVVYYDVGRPFALNCTAPRPDVSVPYVWRKGDKVVPEAGDVGGRFKQEGASLHTVGRSQEDDYGNYTCAATGGAPAQGWELRGRTFAKLPPNTNAVEGQKVKLVCKLIGKPYPAVTWKFSNETDGSNASDAVAALGGRARVQGTVGEELVLEEVRREDAGEYTCVPEGSAPATTRLRVKGMYAALWPFLGICAEVFVLCAIILVYEKRRTKPELDDSDTDNHDQKKS